jgi:hypothetical protein
VWLALQPIVALVPMHSRRAVLLIGRDGTVTLLLPKGLEAQVGAVTKRKHYKEAVGIAEDALERLVAAARLDEAEETRVLIANTEAKFAAHLLERAGEPEAAMQHYIKTIGYVLRVTT